MNVTNATELFKELLKTDNQGLEDLVKSTAGWGQKFYFSAFS